MRSLRNAWPLLLLVAGACDSSSRIAMGDVNSIIVVADSALWREVGDTLRTALQPEIFAVRPEPAFNVTYVSPAGREWPELQRFRSVLAIGTAADPWVAEVLAAADTAVTAPALVRATDVWVRNQRATALVVPAEGAAAAVRERAGQLADVYDRAYREWAVGRMYTSGVDSALADTFRAEGGFTAVLPNVYTFRREGERGFLAFNDQEAGTPLVRSFYVTWRPGTDGPITPEQVLAWRDSIGQTVYDWPQRVLPEQLRITEIEGPGPGARGIEVRGAWTGTADETFPQAGPFVTRVIDCPAADRRYLVDTWLYAPATDKYQYMIQLETLQEGFECGAP